MHADLDRFEANEKIETDSETDMDVKKLKEWFTEKNKKEKEKRFKQGLLRKNSVG